jgi:hypothetical protein
MRGTGVNQEKAGAKDSHQPCLCCRVAAARNTVHFHTGYMGDGTSRRRHVVRLDQFNSA